MKRKNKPKDNKTTSVIFDQVSNVFTTDKSLWINNNFNDYITTPSVYSNEDGKKLESKVKRYQKVIKRKLWINAGKKKR